MHVRIRFPYVINLQALGNDLQVTKSGVEEFLPAATVMVVFVTASATQGLVVFFSIISILIVFYSQKMEQDELNL